jgi:hypothetical protein
MKVTDIIPNIFPLKNGGTLHQKCKVVLQTTSMAVLHSVEIIVACGLHTASRSAPGCPPGCVGKLTFRFSDHDASRPKTSKVQSSKIYER